MLNHLQTASTPLNWIIRILLTKRISLFLRISLLASLSAVFFLGASYWSPRCFGLAAALAFCTVAISVPFLHLPEGVPFLYFLWWSPSHLFYLCFCLGRQWHASLTIEATHLQERTIWLHTLEIPRGPMSPVTACWPTFLSQPCLHIPVIWSMGCFKFLSLSEVSIFKSSEILIERKKQEPPLWITQYWLGHAMGTNHSYPHSPVSVASTQVACRSHWGHQGILAVLRVTPLLPSGFWFVALKASRVFSAAPARK